MKRTDPVLSCCGLEPEGIFLLKKCPIGARDLNYMPGSLA